MLVRKVMRSKLALVSVSILMLMLLCEAHLIMFSPEAHAAREDLRFQDTRSTMSIPPDRILWDEKNDPHAVRLTWNLGATDVRSGMFSVEGISPIPYNYAALYWVADGMGRQIRPEEFTVVYESMLSGESRDSPTLTTGTEHPLSRARDGEFLAPFHAIVSGRPRNAFAVSITSPEGVALRSVTLVLAHHFAVEPALDREGNPIQTATGTSVTSSNLLASRPPIIARSSWWGSLPVGELNSPRWPPAYQSITHAIIHHTADAHNSQPTQAEAANWVRSIWRWHATLNAQGEGHNWGDIGYNFIVDRFGNIYHGRHNPHLDGSPPQDVIGGHAYGFNTGTMGLAFLGWFHAGIPSSAALASAEHLLAWRFRLRSLDPLGQALLSGRMLSRITGHDHTGGGTGAGCPGMPITNYLPTMRTNVSLRMRQVVAPNGGEVWPLNTQQTIRWDFAAISGDVRVDLSTNGGSGWSTIIPRTPNNGAAQWMVTGLASTQARVRVLSLDSPSVSDDSNGNFTIAGLHVTSPQGGESWRNSTLQTLRWNSVGVVGNVNIDLSIDGGVSWVALFMNTPNDGEQSWNVNATPTTNARIRIASVSDARIVALSPNPFTILPVEHQ